MGERRGMALGGGKRPSCPLAGQDGNIYSLISAASEVLRRNDLRDQEAEMIQRIMYDGCEDYSAALRVINEYVDITGEEDTGPEAAVRPERGNFCTVNELLASLEPQTQDDKDTMRKCISSLTDYAARLAAQGREEQLPTLRRMIVEMAGFWGLEEDDAPNGVREGEAEYEAAFDRTVSAARGSGHSPELSDQAKRDILAGLELYALEMADCGNMERWIDECETLSGQLRAEWQLENMADGIKMEGL